jgi:hypothetical protein
MISKKVVWDFFKISHIVDHSCSALPADINFHKVKIECDTEDRRLFKIKGTFTKTSICPYCNEELEYVFVNKRKVKV